MYKASYYLLGSGITLLIIAFGSQVYAQDQGQKTATVTLSGEFHAPGVHTIAPGETLLSLVSSTGGLTQHAYPVGAIMTRKSLREQARRQRQRVLQDLQSVLNNLPAARPSAESAAAVVYMQYLIRSLQQAAVSGRMIVQTDPTLLQVRNELDTKLQDGDVIHMPNRPNTLRVMGEVLNPGSFPFVSGQNADDYIETAGGITEQADAERIFAVLPNGLTQALSISYWNYTPIHLAPGSMIVVPRVSSPFDELIPMHDVQRLLAQAAISSVHADVK